MPTLILMRTEQLIIAQGSFVSPVLAIPDVTIVGIIAPNTIDHNTLYFDVSADGSVYVPLSDMDGVPVRCLLAAQNAVTMDIRIFRPWWYMRLRLTVAAAASRRYTLLVRPAWGG
jgi:hypothetical protein